MTLPNSLLPTTDILLVLLKSRTAIKSRLERTSDQRMGGTTRTIRDGKPKVRNLPDEPIGIWLHFARLVPDPDAPYQSDGFFGVWEVSVVVRDSGTDKHGFDESKALAVLAGIVRVLTETEGDVSFDSSVDHVEILSAEHVIGTVAGGDLEVAEMLVVFRAWHPYLMHDR